METRVYNDLAIYGSAVFAKSLADFPTTPRDGEIVLMDNRHYAYTKISPTFSTWLPLGNKQTAYVHSQGVASTTWTIEHNLGTTDYGLFVYDSDHNLIMVSHEPTDANTVSVILSEAITGTAVLFAVTNFSSASLSTSSLQLGDITLTGNSGLLYVSGNEVALTTSLNAEITARINADASLASAIGSVTGGGGGVGSASTESLNTEITARINADVTLQNNLNAEVTARINGDNALSVRVAALESAPAAGTGKTVLDASYFYNPTQGMATHKWLSIGTGLPGAAAADFVDVYAFADFINSTSNHTTYNIYGYFKEPGIINLTKDLHFTNSESNGRVGLLGSPPPGQNPDYGGTSYANITAFISHTINASVWPETSTFVLEVDSTTNMFVGSVIAIYPQSAWASVQLPDLKGLVGTYTVTNISGTTITVEGFSRAGAVLPSSPLSGIDVNSLQCYFNHTVINGYAGPDTYYGIYISGGLGDIDTDGGLYDLSFSECGIRLNSPAAHLVLYSNIHFRGMTSRLRATPGLIYSTADLFLDGYEGIYVTSSFFGAYADIYLGFGGSSLSFYGGKASIARLISRVPNPNIVTGDQGEVVFFNPIVAELGNTWQPTMVQDIWTTNTTLLAVYY